MIIFYLENTEYRLNLEKAGLKTSGGDPAIKTGPMFDALYYARHENSVRTKVLVTGNRPKDKKYIVPVGVGHSPGDWAKEQLFDAVMPFAEDMRQGLAFLMIDQSHEGHHATWLFQWFHNICEMYKLPVSQIIYVTGDLTVSEKYAEWSRKRGYKKKIMTIPYVHFEQFIFQQMEDFGTVSFDEHVDYKLNNLNSVNTYNCLQKRPRGHRIYLYDKLEQEGLLEHGINSMNAIDLEATYINMPVERRIELNVNLPLLPINFKDDNSVFSSDDCGHYIGQLNTPIMLQSFLTVVSEASYFSNTCFISEKTFKPIAAQHPFIIFGNPRILKKLRNMGYRTFNGLIDEQYDLEDDLFERIDRISHELKQLSLQSPENQLKWFLETREICEHNYQVFIDNCTKHQRKRFIPLFNYIKRS